MTVSSRKSGFTLVELLVVIGIIALLISILLPALNKARTQAQVVACAAKMKQLGMASVLYVNDNRGYLPTVVAQGNVGSGNGVYGRPAIISNGGYASTISRYLNLKDDAGLNTNAVTASVRNNRHFVCPSQEGEALSLVDAFSYRYHQQLGGDDAARVPAGTSFPVPWKLSQVKQSSMNALFIESLLQQGPGPNRNTMTFSWESGAKYTSGPSNGLFYQTCNRTNGEYLHGERRPGPSYTYFGVKPVRVGITNVVFADGSVRALRQTSTRLAETNAYAAWPDGVIFNPYKPTNTW